MAQAFSTVARTAVALRSAVLAEPLRLSKVHGHTQAAIALVLHGVHFAQAHRGAKAALQADIGLTLGGSGTLGFRHDVLDDLGQLRDPGGVDFLLHVPCRCVGAEL
jgi:hypothetical protein